ncbi:hypothetical protein GIB67_024615 [Kingdonia uniflora]|uniref:Uncharacterized protein n=1 Tax=Kingdonia uniflora TaxID=39325 RepID=A0A7J7LPB7_9MAGN|nr:hypothetical protein GIB67_024615 [Kingdonia uniflora]
MPSFTYLKSTINKPTFSKVKPFFSTQLPRSLLRLSRVPCELGCLQSLMPLHSAVSSVRLTSCLGARNVRSLSQGMLCRANPGVKLSPIFFCFMCKQLYSLPIKCY